MTGEADKAEREAGGEFARVVRGTAQARATRAGGARD